MDEALIKISNVSKRFGRRIAIDAVDLTVKRGEFFGLLGPSGCGKTTLLRMIGGLTLPDSGSIVLDGEDMTQWPADRRPTNMVFQSYALFPHLSVYDNVGYGLRKAAIPGEERKTRIQDALALVKLEGFGPRRTTELSGGERQRVALARALIMRPKVLLLDEPLGALDKRLRDAMQVELRELQRELGITFVFVTHDQEEALSMSDRIAVMEKGRLLQIADPKTLYETPVNREVASFIGIMNFFQGSIAAISPSTLAVTIAGAVFDTLPDRAAARPFRAGDRVTVAIRPEKISFSSGHVAGPALRGRIAAISYLGDRQQIQVTVPGAVAPVVVVAPSASGVLAVGMEVDLSWAPDAPVLLPAD